jgi:mannosylglycerate hydrolase
MALRVAVVPHTHWDREWYEPFQSFRLRLVETVDALLDLLERDPSYRRFLLDGQMAVVDDYLEVRPEAEERLRALAGAGRLQVGPWYALMDEFLVSGETIVRDLQMGMRRAAAFGGPMPVGYLPDMFGHVAQMPQILRLAGLHDAVVWRGVPSAITKTAFWWEAPDGSAVRAEYLPFGYGNGAMLPDDAKSLLGRVGDHVTEVRSFLVGDLLYLNGSDHLPPQPSLGRLLAEANAIQDDYVFEITSLTEYLSRARGAGGAERTLERWRGELRSGARANVLMGVTSNRVDVRRATAAVERTLERRAEPYAALFQDVRAWPGRLLDLAWSALVRNAAHDSICACSVDDVVDAVLERAAEARAIADGLASRALGSLARSVADAGLLVVNASSHARSGVVEVTVGDDGGVVDALAADGTARQAGSPGLPAVQVVSERAPLPDELEVDAETARTVVAALEGTRIDDDAWVTGVRIDEGDSGIDVRVTIGPEEREGPPIAQAKQELLGRLAARPTARVRVQLDQRRIRRIVARVEEVPGFGWRAFAPAPLAHPVVVREGRDDGVELSNGLTTVLVDERSGTFTLDGVAGMGRVVDGGDFGDSYNYSPPAHDLLVDTPAAVTLEVTERGPVRARVVVTALFRWPDHVDAISQRREGEQSAEVSTTLELRADEPALRVTTSLRNQARDHRVRLHFPLPRPAPVSEAECAFGTVRRGLSAEGRPGERGLPTFPARRFVRAGGLTAVFDGATEYELVDVSAGRDGDAGPGPAGPDVRSDGTTARTLALTLLRATGMLSRVGMAYRPFPAGPLLAVDGLQLLGRRVELRYALCPGDVDPWRLADDVLLPLETVLAPGGGHLPPTGTALEVAGAEVSAVRRAGPLLEVRVFNPGDRPSLVTFADRRGWTVDLRGKGVEPFDGSFSLRAHGIATVQLAEA